MDEAAKGGNSRVEPEKLLEWKDHSVSLALGRLLINETLYYHPPVFLQIIHERSVS
jgi:hypothetical protein